MRDSEPGAEARHRPSRPFRVFSIDKHALSACSPKRKLAGLSLGSKLKLSIHLRPHVGWGACVILGAAGLDETGRRRAWQWQLQWPEPASVRGALAPALNSGSAAGDCQWAPAGLVVHWQVQSWVVSQLGSAGPILGAHARPGV